MSIKVINLNRLSYLSALDIQQKLFQKVKNAVQQQPQQHQQSSLMKKKINYLLLVEHEPVYTVGIRNKQYLDLEFQNKLKNLGAHFVITNRGGLITFHGPGQLVAYPIINLADFVETRKSIKTFVCLLESVIIDVCKDFNITATRLDSYPGVWVGEGNRKIAAVGIHASRYVTMHGIALNCNIDLEWFQHIVPCGIEDKIVSSLSNELDRQIDIAQVMPLFVDHFSKRLQCQIE